MRRLHPKRLISVMMFDLPLSPNYISTEFSRLHEYHQVQDQDWPFQATRGKMAAEYWFRHVLASFAAILTGGALVSTLFVSEWSQALPALVLVGAITFLTLTGIIYYPAYKFTFLPYLETVISKKEAQLIKIKEEPIKRCKTTQFSIPTLTVIFYVFCKISKSSFLPTNDESAALLNQLFGVTNKSLKDNLSRLERPARISDRERAEMRKAIEEAATFFQQLNNPAALKELHLLEIQFSSQAPSKLTDSSK
ncbi:hypothetical protein [Paraflavitalea sp. CAU 1676]|uniref:hypothetical protein n=1 Tax=Paraflavitalea sp. CAU 1676 TaxID=3032598 RepID=UPI0023DCD44F|nr:hypothetical protein [Paraflavitalea sp. CAU 1676]MDF2188311.1 hypothetical protein [Paraflavitalea sp. CAU 1676]